MVGLFWDSWFTLSSLSVGTACTLGLCQKALGIRILRTQVVDGRIKYNGIPVGVAESG